MVTKVTRDVTDLTIRAIQDGIRIAGDNSFNFSIDGTDIGFITPAEGTFTNLGADDLIVDNLTTTDDLIVTGTVSGAGFDKVLAPVGAVVMFNAAFAGLIPTNWQLCDGTNGTPNMTSQFVYGTNTEGQLLDSGGVADAVNVAHGHTGSTNSTGSHTHSFTAAQPIGGHTDDGGSPDQRSAASARNTAANGNHSHTVTVANSGVSGTNKNLPPYIKLAFIQRMS